MCLRNFVHLLTLRDKNFSANKSWSTKSNDSSILPTTKGSQIATETAETSGKGMHFNP